MYKVTILIRELRKTQIKSVQNRRKVLRQLRSVTNSRSGIKFWVEPVSEWKTGIRLKKEDARSHRSYILILPSSITFTCKYNQITSWTNLLSNSGELSGCTVYDNNKGKMSTLVTPLQVNDRVTVNGSFISSTLNFGLTHKNRGLISIGILEGDSRRHSEFTFLHT